MGQERPELVHYARKKAVAFKLAGDLVGDAAWLRPGLRAGLQERAKARKKACNTPAYKAQAGFLSRCLIQLGCLALTHKHT